MRQADKPFFSTMGQARISLLEATKLQRGSRKFSTRRFSVAQDSGSPPKKGRASRQTLKCRFSIMYGQQTIPFLLFLY